VDDGFEGRAALVTGGGTGMGRAFAVALAAAGARVAVCGRRPEPLEETVALCAEAGGEAVATPLDVRDADGVEAWVADCDERLGPPRILVNNAAGNFICPAMELSPNGWRAVVDIVLNGTFLCSRAVGRRMRDSGRGGAILNVVATYAWTGHPGTAHSAAAKAGVWNLTKTLGVEWAPFGIRVNAIAPGPIETPGATANLFPTEEIRASMIEGIPARRFGELDDVVAAAMYLLSDRASYVTGECLTVDGGSSLEQGMFRFSPATPRERPASA
jgi:NAD(P)-dependent dehydrogenase (short-subunit alcohol dehydrogenase family)